MLCSASLGNMKPPCIYAVTTLVTSSVKSWQLSVHSRISLLNSLSPTAQFPNGIVERKNSNVLAHPLCTPPSMFKSTCTSVTNSSANLQLYVRVERAMLSYKIIFSNSIHLNRGVDNSFLPLLPPTNTTNDYIQDLNDSQTAVIQASQKHLARSKDTEVSKKKIPPPVSFPVCSRFPRSHCIQHWLPSKAIQLHARIIPGSLLRQIHVSSTILRRPR